MSRVSFALQALDHFATELRRKKAPSTKALGPDLAKQYGELTGKVIKRWWATITPEERSKRARRAAETRWAKKKPEK